MIMENPEPRCPIEPINPIACFLSGLWTIVFPTGRQDFVPYAEHIQSRKISELSPEDVKVIERRYAFLIEIIQVGDYTRRIGTLKALEIYGDERI